MKSIFKRSVLSSAIIGGGIVPIAYAQEESTLETEEVIVVGFKASLEKALDRKRDAKGVVDSIFAEDVGKSTDQNIADALSRVTGVSVQEENGEGTRISVRGAGANLNQISLNGVALTSGLSGIGDGAISEQSVDLSAYSSDILSSIDVLKTASANQDEGSLGANVVLRTRRPLTLKRPIHSLEFQLKHNDYIGENDRKISGTFSKNFLDNTLGVIATFTDEDQSSRRDEYRGSWNSTVRRARPNNARDFQTGEIIDDNISFLTMGAASYRLHNDSYERRTGTVGIQFQPTDVTDIMLDLSFANRESQIDNHDYNMQMDLTGGETGFDRNGNPGDPLGENGWWVIDQENNTQVKRLVRAAKGRLFRDKGGQDTKSKVASLSVSHDINENFNVEFLAGYSSTTERTLPYGRILVQPRFQTISGETPLTSDDPNDITLEPSGFDCTTGQCRLVVSEQFSFIDLETPTNSVGPNINNPLDQDLWGITRVNRFNNRNEDVNTSFFLDFDWKLDAFGIDTIQFGAKVSSRNKDVHSVTTTISNGTTVFDSEGNPLQVNGLNTIHISEIYEDAAFPVDDFMSGLVGVRQPWMNGWGLIDPFRALDIVSPNNGSGGKDVVTEDRPDGTREVTQDVNSVYVQFDFDYLDGRVTGNFGVRHVTTDVEATAFQSLRFWDSGNSYDVFDLIYNRQLANRDLPACWQTLSDPNNPVFPQNDQGNNDFAQNPINLPEPGTCFDWQLTHSFRWDQPETHPEIDPVTGLLADGGDPTNPALLLDVQYDSAGNVVAINKNADTEFGRNGRFPRNVGQNNIRAWTDRTTYSRFKNGGTEELGSIAGSRSLQFTDSHDYRNLLPSLNINLLVTEELIARFATSKTIARPRFDTTLPSIRITEASFQDFGSGNLKTVKLEPLESNNLDFSLEWYFNKDSVLSTALFHKDMSNFEEEVGETFLLKDERTNYQLENVSTLADLLVVPTAVTDAEGNQVFDSDTGLPVWEETPVTTREAGDQCLPDRSTHVGLQDSLTFNCATFTLQSSRNGKGASISGLEFGYTQNYSFLPGIWSGLGFSVNYTYQDSESEEELSETTGRLIKPLPQAFTPKHSANTTLYWEKDNLMFRLANRYNSVQLVSRGAVGNNAAIWQEGTSRLDFSSYYKISDTISLTFQALNLTDETTRRFITSHSFVINGEIFDEGNAQDQSVYKGRTERLFKTGRQYRLGLRAKF